MRDLILDQTGRLAALRFVPNYAAGEVFYGFSQVYDLATGTPLHEYNEENFGTLAHAFSPDGSYYVFAGGNDELWFYGTDGALLARISDMMPLSNISDLKISPDGQWLAVAGTHADMSEAAWLLRLGSDSATLISADAAQEVIASRPPLRWSGSTLTAQAAIPSPSIIILSAETGDSRDFPLAEAVAVASGGQYAVIHADGTVGIYNIADGNAQTAVAETAVTVDALVFSADETSVYGYGISRAYHWRLPADAMP
jgi:WD40 repeat protein